MDGNGVKLGEIERHFWLTRSVARVMKLSFADAMAEGDLTAKDYAEIVTRCRAGGCSMMCEAWLACQTDHVDQAPPHCANAAILNALKDR